MRPFHKLCFGWLGLWFVTACPRGQEVPAVEIQKSPAEVRAERRAYDGAPPVIPHPPMGASCTECHHARGLQVKGQGFAPPSPHVLTEGMSTLSRCQQCHVQKQTSDVFVDHRFVGWTQPLNQGPRAHDHAPPMVPHGLLMRENCQACHTGAAAREAIRTSHPERIRCVQCHLIPVESGTFHREEKGTPS